MKLSSFYESATENARFPTRDEVILIRDSIVRNHNLTVLLFESTESDEPDESEYSIQPLLMLDSLKELRIMQRFVRDINQLAVTLLRLEKVEFILCEVLEEELKVLLEEPRSLKKLSLVDCCHIDLSGDHTEPLDTDYYTQHFEW